MVAERGRGERMIHPIPSGTRDVLPDEMRELRAITDRLRAVFDAAGYGEIQTPALEYESELGRGQVTGAYRVFDEHGETLVLRSDMTVPIARVVASRYAAAEPPLRFCYCAHAYRELGAGTTREFLQAGIELVGAPAPGGTAEALTVLCDALDAVGLEGYRVGVGDASLYPRLLERLGVGEEGREALLHELVTRDFAGLERHARELGVDRVAVELPQRRGGVEVLDHAPGPVADAVAGLRAIAGGVEPRVAERLIFDLGLVRQLGYYTGAVFQVYAPALGVPIGSGGRYDDLVARFGRPLPAVGFALAVEQLHVALSGQGRPWRA